MHLLGLLLFAGSLLHRTDPGEDTLLVLRVTWQKHVLSEGLIAYASASDVLLPLSELCNLLEFPIQIDPERGVAQGWFLKEDRRFLLDLATGKTLVEGKPGLFDSSRMLRIENDIFVEANLIAQWFPVQFLYLPSEMRLKVLPTEPLPMALRMERSKTRIPSGDNPRGYKGIWPMKPNPYKALDWPFLEAAFRVNLLNRNGSAQTNGAFSLRGSGDLAFMNSEFFLLGRSDDRDSGLQNIRLKLGRTMTHHTRDPIRWEVGDILPDFPTELAVNTQRMGASITNFPLHRPATFDTIQLKGNLPPGWEVELYRNGVLLDFVESESRGHYVFDDVQLLYGRNVMRMVFYGPQGQHREEEKTYFIDASLIEPGKTRYALSWQGDQYFIDSQAPHEQEGLNQPVHPRINARLDRGLSRALAVSLNLSHLYLDQTPHLYGGIGLRASFWGSHAAVDLIRDARGGHVSKTSFHTRKRGIDLRLSHRAFASFESETYIQDRNPVKGETDVTLSGSFQTGGGKTLAYTLSADHEKRMDGQSATLWQNRVSTNLFGLAVSHIFTYRLDARAAEPAGGSLLAGGRLGGYRIRGALGYHSRLDKATLEISKLWNSRLKTRVSIDSSFGNGEAARVRSSAHWTLPRLVLSLNANHAPKTGLEANFSLSLNLGREPRTGDWTAQSRPILNHAGASALVYLDRNLNGRLDPQDTLLEGVRFTVNQTKSVTGTDDKGVAFFKQLPAHTPLDLEIIPSSLPDPSFTPRVGGLGIQGRPGSVQLLDFPIVETGDIEGRIRLKLEEGSQPISNVNVLLLNDQGQIIRRAKTDYDGFYLFDRLPPGSYSTIVDTQQMARLGLQAASPQKGVVNTGGQVVVLDISLHRNTTP